MTDYQTMTDDALKKDITAMGLRHKRDMMQCYMHLFGSEAKAEQAYKAVMDNLKDIRVVGVSCVKQLIIIQH
jgi:hypothetical protein